MATIDRMKTDGTFENMSKRERFQVSRQREKMEKNLGSIADLTRLPSALFIVDIVKEHIAVAEARKLGIPTFAMVDTNSDPSLVDFPIPANDDATKSIELIVDEMIAAINEGMEERKNDKTARRKHRRGRVKKKLAEERLLPKRKRKVEFILDGSERHRGENQ
jgi:small subunit ribosomal protein S2